MGDYINRRDAIRAIEESLRFDRECGRTDWHFENARQRSIADINSVPAADVQPVVCGRWIARRGKLYCSACGKRACVTRDIDDFWYIVGTKYCPECGAEMDIHGTAQI